jgi:hypothetical protein
MALYIDADLITDETSTIEAVLAGTADRINTALDLAEDEGWEPHEGSPETSLGEAVGIVIATACSMVQEEARQDYAGFGELVLAVPRTRAEPATGYSRWDFNVPGNYRIPDGAELILDAADGTPVAYAVVGDVIVENALAATDVEVVAIEPGSIANGLLGPARDWEPLPFVTGVSMTTAPDGGTDDQTRDQYLNDVTRKARRMKLVPIVTDDYADTAVDHPNVAAAIAVRLLNLDAPTDPPAAGGHVTVFGKGFAGEVLPQGVKDEVIDSMMGEDRPLAVTVHFGDPTYTDLTIAVDMRLAPGADHDATVAAVQDAIAGTYNPASYGLDENAPGRWRAPRSVEERTINDYDVAAVIDDVFGVARIEDVTINGVRSVTLNGWAPLPVLTAPATVTVL